MSLLLSRSCEYGIQATFYISFLSPNKLVSIKEISERLNIPSPYLAKILQSLAKRGILSSIKGPNGGFKLGRSADTIVLKDIVEGIDGLYALDKCVLGFEKCDEHNPCPLHETWSAIKKNIIDSILLKSISELGSGMKLRLENVEENIFF